MLLFTDLITGTDKNTFLAKIESVAASLGYSPNWLLAVMHSETGGTFSASIRNSISGATGLIQFMPSTAIDLGTTVAALAQMSRTAQMDYVYKYYNRWKQTGRVAKSYEDLYLTTFYPAAIGRPDSFRLGSEVSDSRARQIAAQNPFDYDGDGYISIADFKQFVYRNYILKYVPENLMYLLRSNTPASVAAKATISITLLGLTTFLLYKYLHK